MKKIKKLIVAILIVVMVGSFSGCGKKVDNSDKTLEVAFLDAGYGYEFISKWGEKFEALHPGVSVVLSKSSDILPEDLLSAGAKGNSVDLFISGTIFDNFARKGANMLKGYDCVLEPIDEVLSTEVEGTKIMDKFMDGYKPNKINDHYYSFNWAMGLTGLVYNETKFLEKGYAVPTTTDELLELCEEIKSDSLIPFVFSSATGYWTYLKNIWYMQYEGVEGMNNFFNGIDEGAYSKEIFRQQGRLVSLETLDSVINVEKKNIHNSVNTLTFTQAQAQLILGNGLMMVNGDWLENEMKNTADEDKNNYSFKMMSPPVVSEIIKKCPSIKDDATLRKVVAYVDGKDTDITKISGVTKEDIDRVDEARHCRYSIGMNHSIGIPVYSTAKELAKEFIKYMATEEAQLIYMDTTSGNMMPFRYDIENNEGRWNAMSNYSKSIYALYDGAKYYSRGSDAIYGLTDWTGGRENPEIFFTAKSAKDRKTPSEVFEEEYKYWTAERWNLLLKSAGVI